MVIWMVLPLVEANGVVDASAGTLAFYGNLYTSTAVNNNDIICVLTIFLRIW